MGKAFVSRRGGVRKYFTLSDCTYHEVGTGGRSSITLPEGVSWGSIKEFSFSAVTSSYQLSLSCVKQKGNNLFGIYAGGSAFVTTPNSTDTEISVTNGPTYSASTYNLQCAIVLN